MVYDTVGFIFEITRPCLAKFALVTGSRTDNWKVDLCQEDEVKSSGK